MYREIAAKTLYGRGKVHILNNKEIKIDKDVTKPLGCWIINLEYDTKKEDKKITLFGTYDVQLWYASDHNQKSEVYTEKVSFESEALMAYRDLVTLSDKWYLKVRVNKYPVCIKMDNDKNIIKLTIESLFFIDCFAESLLVVNCADNQEEDIDLDEEILMNVNQHYLEDKSNK